MFLLGFTIILIEKYSWFSMCRQKYLDLFDQFFFFVFLVDFFDYIIAVVFAGWLFSTR